MEPHLLNMVRKTRGDHTPSLSIFHRGAAAAAAAALLVVGCVIDSLKAIKPPSVA